MAGNGKDAIIMATTPVPASAFQPLADLSIVELQRAASASLAARMALPTGLALRFEQEVLPAIMALQCTPQQLAVLIERQIPFEFHQAAAVGQGLELHGSMLKVPLLAV